MLRMSRDVHSLFQSRDEPGEAWTAGTCEAAHDVRAAVAQRVFILSTACLAALHCTRSLASVRRLV